MSLKGKTALVTGSTSGIGLGIAIELARQGAHIVMNGFGDVDAPRRQIEACGVQTAYHGADMSKPAEIEAMMASQRSVGKLSIGETCWMPALLTRMSTAPKSASQRRTMSSISAGLLMSAPW